ncbi:MAG: T9SS type A sorting domain-containing protein [Prolixibacteraceae bacterium]|nr:T9SS type A sorting domain-containing protein [Prolixibacteraceae bacterium]
MKIIFTFLFIATLLMSGFAQNAGDAISKSSNLNSRSSLSPQLLVVEKVYPNPVKDLVYVDIQSKTASPVLINLYSILGTEVKKWESVELHEGTQKIKLDLSELKSGLYILKFSVNGQTYSQVVKKT